MFQIKADFIIILHYRKYIAKQFYEGIKLFYYKYENLNCINSVNYCVFETIICKSYCDE